MILRGVSLKVQVQKVTTKESLDGPEYILLVSNDCWSLIST